MSVYEVVDSSHAHARNLVCLCDEDGNYHVAQVTSPAPSVGVLLAGSRPLRGFSVMTGMRTGQIFRLIFELIDCGQAAALERIHGAVPA